MAVAWTTITNGQVAAGAPVTTALMTALRDNPEGIAQRATGAPKIFGNAYDYQEFTTAGTWTKPSNAESGDVVIAHCVGGGGAGGQSATGGSGGGGGGGAMNRFDDIDLLPATVSTMTIGAGGTTAGTSGGLSTFGAVVTAEYLRGTGGTGGANTANTGGGTGGYVHRAALGNNNTSNQNGGNGGNSNNGANSSGDGSITGGGGGGGSDVGSTLDSGGGPSMYAGGGGLGGGSTTDQAALRDALFPGGGGGGHDTSHTGTFGDGADGVIRVWCLREDT